MNPFDDLIRRAAGVASPQDVAAWAIAAAEQSNDAGELRSRVAAAAGIPAALAPLLEGDDAAALQAHAKRIGDAIAEMNDGGPSKPASFDDVIRRRAGGGDLAAATDPGETPPPTSFDGGARSVDLPSAEPSFDSLLRATKDVHDRDVAERAADYEHNRR